MRFRTSIGVLLLSTSVWAAKPAPVQNGAKKTQSKVQTAKTKKLHRPVVSGRLATASELRNDALALPSGHIELFAVNFAEGLDVDLFGPDHTYNQEALEKLNHFWRCKRTDTEKAIDPRLFEVLSHVYDHFHKRIELVSGFRNQERTSSFHFHGSASDIRIPGVSEKELHQFVTSLDIGGMGIGLYPKAGFIHVDIRPEPSYRWVDYTPSGQKSPTMRRADKKKSKQDDNDLT